jgi:very-short-patch-repair endonuclease
MPRKTQYEQEQLAELIRRQRGVIGRDQALSCGLTRKALEYRIRAGGAWQRVLPGVYLAGTGTASAEQRDVAALLHAGPRSVLTGLAAVRRNSFRVAAPSVITVLVPAGVRRQSTGFVQVQRTTRMPAEFCVDGEVRFVLAARAVADAARSLRSGREVRALVAQAIQQQRCLIEMLAAELEQGPGKGAGLLRAALAEVEVGIRSVPEGDLRALLKRRRVPMPMFNARLYAGTTLIGVADAWWPDAGVVAEVDSREYHYSAEDWQGTMRRHDRLVAHGVLLLHFTPKQIRGQPEEVVAQIRAALAAGRGRRRLPVTYRAAA